MSIEQKLAKTNPITVFYLSTTEKKQSHALFSFDEASRDAPLEALYAPTHLLFQHETGETSEKSEMGASETGTSGKGEMGASETGEKSEKSEMVQVRTRNI